MRNLINELTKNTNKRIECTLSSFRSEIPLIIDKLTRVERQVLSRKEVYKRNRISQVENRIKHINFKILENSLSKVQSIKNASDKLPNDLILTINFYKSSVWGYCPKGNDNYGNSTSSITGCGYCKESTATAQLLNQNDIIMKKLYKAKNKQADEKNNDVLGYGSGYGILPTFEGGVGVSCHVRILESLGYKVTQSGNNVTTILIVSEGE